MELVLAQLGPAVAFLGLLLYFGRQWIAGRFYTKLTVDDMKENFNQQILRERKISDDWRQVALNNTEAIAKLSSQMERLIESQQTIEAFILSIPRRPRELQQGSGGTYE